MINGQSSKQKRSLNNIVFYNPSNQSEFKRYRPQPETVKREYPKGMNGAFYQESIPGTFYNTLNKNDLIRLIIRKNQYIDTLRTFIKENCSGQITGNILNNKTQSDIEIEETFYSKFVPYELPQSPLPTPSPSTPSSEVPSQTTPSEPSASSPTPRENTPMTPPRPGDIQVIDPNVFPDVPEGTPKEINGIIRHLQTQHRESISINKKKSIVRKVVWLIILGNIIHSLEMSASQNNRIKSEKLKDYINRLSSEENNTGIEKVINNLKTKMKLVTPALYQSYVYPILQSQSNVATPVLRK
jgi:hypothetical protein